MSIRLVSANENGDEINFENISCHAVSGDGELALFQGLYYIDKRSYVESGVGLFLKNLRTGAVEKVFDNDHFLAATMSSDGRYVAIASDDPGLTDWTHGPRTDIFVYDRATGALVNVTAGADASSFSPELSGDGRTLVFQSEATNLVPGDRPWATDVFSYDLASGVFSAVSSNSDGPSTQPSISYDGSRIVFVGDAWSLGLEDAGLQFGNELIEFDPATGGYRDLTAGGDFNGYGPILSEDGRHVLYMSFYEDVPWQDGNGGYEDVFVLDLDTGRREMISAYGNGSSSQADMSADSRFVVFTSTSTNLVANDSNGDIQDIFIKDRKTGRILLLTPGADGYSFNASISADGRVIVFESMATNLVDGCTTTGRDVFTTANPFLHQREDSNGDYRSDILLRGADGRLTILESQGATGFAASEKHSIDPGWTLLANDDFTADGFADLMWRAADGALHLDRNDAHGGYVRESAGSMPAFIHFAGAGDFNGDSRTDLLWQADTGELILALTRATTGYDMSNLNSLGPDWTALGAGDFNGDGRDDILWRSNLPGNTALRVQTMNWDGQLQAGYAGNAAADLTFEAAADFNGDGRDDILWRNAAGETFVWLATAQNGFEARSLGTSDISWRIAGTGDYNDDGLADILWQRDDSLAAIWNSGTPPALAAADAGNGKAGADAGPIRCELPGTLPRPESAGDLAFTVQMIGFLDTNFVISG